MSLRGFTVSTYRFIFARVWAYKINKLLFELSLRGLGILNYENDKIGGEYEFLKRFSKYSIDSTILDVGANIGKYSNTLKTLCPKANIYAFEPHPKTFNQLFENSKNYGYTAVNFGCGDVPGTLKLYDYENQDGSSHASLYQDVIEGIHAVKSISTDVLITTIDHFVEEHKVSRITLLKIDTEGNELKVLQGAKSSIERNIIDIIHFEFNEMNTSSRVFLRDFYRLLPNYRFYRMLPDGLLCLRAYQALHWELFAYQNIVAVRQDCADALKQALSLNN